METETRVRAIHRDGGLNLLTPLHLPEGAEVSVVVSTPLPNEEHRPRRVEFTYPTRLVPAKRLDELTDLVAVGGDAVADSEPLYD